MKRLRRWLSTWLLDLASIVDDFTDRPHSLPPAPPHSPAPAYPPQAPVIVQTVEVEEEAQVIPHPARPTLRIYREDAG